MRGSLVKPKASISADDLNAEPSALECLTCARIAGLVEIHSDGTWNMTDQGLKGLIEVLAIAQLGADRTDPSPLH